MDCPHRIPPSGTSACCHRSQSQHRHPNGSTSCHHHEDRYKCSRSRSQSHHQRYHSQSHHNSYRGHSRSHQWDSRQHHRSSLRCQHSNTYIHMTEILKDFDFAIAYLNDIIIFSTTAEEQFSHIKKVFGKLCTAKLSVRFSKCHFFTKEIQYLGHIVSIKGIQLLPSKTQAIQDMHPPRMPKQVHTFLGLVGYYRKFIKDFEKIAKPLTLLTCQQVKFYWTPTHHEAFLKL